MKWVCSLAILVIAVFFIFANKLSLLPGESERFEDIQGQSWLERQDLLVYLQAITELNKHSLYLDETTKAEEIIQDTIKAFVTDLDSFSDYLTHEELAEFRKSQNSDYVGIGIEIQKDGKGNIICFPYPGSPAEQAGIDIGDQIKAINGQSVKGKSLWSVASMARGKEQTAVSLRVQKYNGSEIEVTLNRSVVTTGSVHRERHAGLTLIKIRSFTPDVKRELKYQLDALEDHQPLILDLRSNAGGDLDSAIAAADLFLDREKTIASIRSKTEFKTYQSTNGSANLDTPLFILQNEGTASAAEVFIAALTENNRATSVGRKSFGKGTTQEIIELGDQSALLLTTGYLLTPSGAEFDTKGLSPTYLLESRALGTDDYIDKIKSLLGAD